MTKTPAALRPRFPFTAINALIDPVRNHVVPLDSSAVMKWAERITGLRDWGGNGFPERLDAALEGLVEADLSTTGLLGARYTVNWHLCNRLRVVDLLRRRPDLAEIPIEKPIVITGFYRTGTTFLHSVFAADPGNRVGRAWELLYPVGRSHQPLDDRLWRRRRAELTLGLNHAFMPDQEVAHHVMPDSFEECLFLLQNDMASVTLHAGFGANSYATKMLEWDMLEPYRFHKAQLQILTAQRSAKRWSLKCPWHLWYLDTLLRVYPDARIIQTHRDPTLALGSQCSLCARMSTKVQRSVDLRELGAFWLEYSRIGLERGMRARASLPESQVYDLRLRDLLAHPIETLKDIYEHFDLEYEDGLTDRFLARIAEQPTGHQGEHDYSIEEFGLTEAKVRATFADYCERFGV